MNRATVTCVLAAALLCCGSAHGLNYVWNGTTNGGSLVAASWIQPPGWANSIPNDTSDNMIMLTAGDMWMPNSNIFRGGYYASAGIVDEEHNNVANKTYTFASDNGCRGDFIVTGTAQIKGYSRTITYDVAGDLRIQSYTGNSLHYHSAVLRGVNKIIEDNSQSDYWVKVTVAGGAQVYARAGKPVKAQTYQFDGTVTGGVWYPLANYTPGAETTVYMINFGPSGQFTGGTLQRSDPLNKTGVERTFYFGGGTYYDLELTPVNCSYTGTGETRDFLRANGNLLISHNFTFDSNYAGSKNDRHWKDAFDTDNGMGRISNVTVMGDFAMGDPGAAYGGAPRVWFSLFANSSTFDLRGNAAFQRYGYVHGGTSTWKFGGNVNFANSFGFDNSEMDRTTAIVNGAGAQALKFGQKLKLGTLVIDKPSGAATLTDNVLLYGDFRIDCGTFNPSTFYLNFKGGFDNLDAAQVIDAHDADLKKIHVMSGSSTWVKIASDLTVSDNLDIDAGCKLFLNGFDLYAASSDLGRDFVGFTGTFTTREGGEIIGGEIPEPATLLLLATGALGLFGCARRRRMK